MKPRISALALCLCLLCGCAPGSPPPSPSPAAAPSPTPAPAAFTWLHGFYASSSYSQLPLTDHMDAVSLGWGRLRLDETGPWVSATGENGNLWAVPQGSQLVTGHLDQLGIPYNLCVFTSTANRTTLPGGGQTDVLTAAISPDYREATVQVLAAAAEGYSGLTIDFEGLGSAGREDFTAFMALLRDTLPPDQLLYAAVPADHWYKGYDYRALGEVCDKLILMAHDYQWTTAPEENLGTTATDTPVAPIGSVEEALRSAVDPDAGIRDPAKLALAVAFSTAGVKVDEEGRLLDTTVYAPGMAKLARRLAQSDAQPGWDEGYASPYVYYCDEEGSRYRVWYEDARSVRAKIDLCRRYGVGGLSLWRLGIVPQEDGLDVWSVILEEKGK